MHVYVTENLLSQHILCASSPFTAPAKNYKAYSYASIGS